jgi:hypothetical protein
MYQLMLINKVVPKIVEVWPNFDRPGVKVKLQQDGAKSHIGKERFTFNIDRIYVLSEKVVRVVRKQSVQRTVPKSRKSTTPWKSH